MPDAVVYEDQRLPASYANFYICNEYVIVPTFRSAKDDKALQIISICFYRQRCDWYRLYRYYLGLGKFSLLKPTGT